MSMSMSMSHSLSKFSSLSLSVSPSSLSPLRNVFLPLQHLPSMKFFSSIAKPFPIAVAPGDGIGAEIMNSALRVMKATGAPLEYRMVDMGESVYKKGFSSGMTEQTKNTVEETGILFKGPMATPKGKGVKSINVTARKVWSTFVNKRVFESFDGVDTVHSRSKIPISLTMFREAQEDTYGSVEHFQTNDVAQCRRFITRPGCLQLHEYVFATAERKKAKRVTCVHKANIMKLTDGLFLETFYEVAAKYPQVKVDDIIVDDLCMKLVQQPQKFDYLVLPNLQGDIVSDLGAGLIGGLGLCPSAIIGERISIFEAVHGTANDLVGKGIANPTALILSGVMMLRHLGLRKTSEWVDEALRMTIQTGFRTPDIGGSQSSNSVNSEGFTQKIIENIGNLRGKYGEAAQKEFVTVSPPAKLSTNPLLQSGNRNSAEKNTKESNGGIDVFVDFDGSVESLAEIAQKSLSEFAKSSPSVSPLTVKMISNRGTQVWPTGSKFTECVNHFRIRYQWADGKSKGGAERAEAERNLLKIMTNLAQHVRVCSMEMLLEINGQPKYALAQGQ